MSTYLERRRRLIDAADAAYKVARAEVFDTFPEGACLSAVRLTPLQREVLDSLAEAEAELACFRLGREVVQAG